MHPFFQQRVAGVAAMHARASITPAALCAMIGKDQPVQEPRFKIIPLGNNTFDVVEHSTGTKKGERTGHDSACQFARQLEDKADFFAARDKSIKQFSHTLLRWTAGAALMLIVFAYYGAKP
jgi:hypothetical protein